MDKAATQQYTPADHLGTKFRRIFLAHFDRFCQVWDEKFGKTYGYYRKWAEQTIRDFLRCSDPRSGFGHLQCPDCNTSRLVPFTCKRKVCLTCGEKRKQAWVEWLFKEVIFNVRHRHWVFTVPLCIRWVFKKDRKLLGVLSHTAAAFLTECLKHSCGHGDATPGIVAVIQTAGDNLKHNPHIHILSTEGCLADDEKNHYYVAGFMDYDIMRVAWRDRILSVLVGKEAIDRNWAARLRKRYPKGFMLNGFIQDHRGNRNLMKRMASYIAKMPISEKRILSFDEKREKVLIRYKGPVKRRSKLPGHRVAVKNQLELLDPLEFIARVMQHIPDPGQQMIRYYGIYANAARGKRKKMKQLGAPEVVEADFEERSTYRRNWRRLIWKIFGADPLLCPRCGVKMRMRKVYTMKSEIDEFLHEHRARLPALLGATRPPPLPVAAAA